MYASNWRLSSEFDVSGEDLDPVFEEALVHELSGWPEPNEIELSVRISVYETQACWVLYANLPGVRPHDVHVTVTGYMLKLTGEFPADLEQTTGQVYYNERLGGKFRRSIALPPNVDTDSYSLDLLNGLLKITIPKTEFSR
jgi:HSP20 family protein